MTPATSITFNDDGTAWVFYATGFEADVCRLLDRPCETCPMGWQHIPDGATEPEELRRPCDCINGRHTFPLDVECGCTFGTHGPVYPECITTGVRTLRVSVVPGMVARIVGIGQATTDTQYPFITPKVGGGWVLHHIPRAMVQRTTITLPSDAKPGGFAVLINTDRAVRATERNA